MTIDKNSGASFPSASEYILDNFEPIDRIAMLVLNRDLGEIFQRITSALKASSPEFQAWLRYKNVTGSDIYIGMNPLRRHALTRTKKDIKSIRHVYLDLDHGGPEALNSVENSRAVPKPNYVLTSSPGKFQIVWKVEGMGLREAEALLHAMARECGGDPAATDATRVLRLPGFANKKYETNFFVEVRKESAQIYRLGDFKLDIDSEAPPALQPSRGRQTSRFFAGQPEPVRIRLGFCEARTRSWRNPRRSHPPDCSVPSDLQKRPTLLRTAYCYEGGKAL
jgi:hypothetical protein